MISPHTSLLIYQSRLMKYLHCTLILLGFLLHFVTSYIDVEPTEASSPDIHLSLVSSCGNSAVLYWNPPLHTRQGSKLCELTVYETGHLEAEIIDIYPDSKNHHIKLKNLLVGQSYSAFIVCDRSRKTNIIDFIFGKSCQEVKILNEHYNKTSNINENATVGIFKSNEFNAVGLSSAFIFSGIGIILIFVVAYYVWKRYQHRQRVLRIFRQEQNDPFQALYSPAQDSYNV